MKTSKFYYASMISMSFLLLCVPGVDRTILLSAMTSALLQISFCMSCERYLWIYSAALGSLLLLSSFFHPHLSVLLTGLSVVSIVIPSINGIASQETAGTSGILVYVYLLANMTACHQWASAPFIYVMWGLYLFESVMIGYSLLAGKTSSAVLKEDKGASPDARNMKDNPKLVDLYGKYVNLMETEKPYLNDRCTLGDIAAMVYSNKTYLSKSINKYSDTNFCTQMKRYRITYAIELVKRDPDTKIGELAVKSGFNSSVSFAAAFKEIMKMTLYEYQQKVKVEKCRSTKTEQEQ